MSLFPAIESFLTVQGSKYISPDKAGELRETMLDLKARGQAARQEFANLVRDFQTLYPKLSLERTSNWLNQAQILRPHFWNYLRGYGEITEPMFALRLYGTAEDFGVSLEVSFMGAQERRAQSQQAESGIESAHSAAGLLFCPDRWCESTLRSYGGK